MSPLQTVRSRGSRLLLVTALPLAVTLAVFATTAGSATKQESATLVVWDAYGDAADIIAANKLFEKLNPNVKIKRVTKGFNDYYATLKLGLAGNNAPDVALGNQGWAADGALVQARVIDPLEPYAQRYGWLKRGYGNLDEFRFTPDGRNWGKGRLYGLAHWSAPVGFFYNRQKLRRLGLNVPKTFRALERALAVAKRAGEIPIQYANLDKWPGTQEYAMIQNVFVPARQINNFIYGRGTFKTAANVRAARILQNWAQRGYFTPGYNGLSYDQATEQYPKGKGVFFYTGTWQVGAWQTNRNIGFFILPPVRGGPPVSIGTFGEPWHIVSRSEQKDLAARYIDFMTGPRAARVFLNAGTIPSTPPSRVRGAGPVSRLFADALKASAALSQGGGAVKYLGWATPTITNAGGAFVQELMAGRITPQEFVDKMQADYEKFHKSRTKK